MTTPELFLLVSNHPNTITIGSYFVLFSSSFLLLCPSFPFLCLVIFIKDGPGTDFSLTTLQRVRRGMAHTFLFCLLAAVTLGGPNPTRKPALRVLPLVTSLTLVTTQARPSVASSSFPIFTGTSLTPFEYPMQLSHFLEKPVELAFRSSTDTLFLRVRLLHL